MKPTLCCPCIADCPCIAPPPLGDAIPDEPFPLASIYYDGVEKAVRDAYARDYMAFGFKKWDRDGR